MKRIHLFEFEDLPWFPNWIRQCMTRYVQSLHRTLRTASIIAPLVRLGITDANTRIVDLCSGAGGPMIEVAELLRSDADDVRPSLVMTDLFPNNAAAEFLESRHGEWLRYERRPVDAAAVPHDLPGMRTMICSLHHMSPPVATKILKDCCESRQPFLAFELSDNSSPLLLWWVAIPIGFVLSLFLTLRVRPLTATQIVFTYVIPILPFFLAWDGAVSSARTYSQSDLAELLSHFESTDYEWQIAKVKAPGLPFPVLYLLGLPIESRNRREKNSVDSVQAGSQPVFPNSRSANPDQFCPSH